METVSQSLLGIFVSLVLSGCLVNTPPGVPYTPPPEATNADDTARLIVAWAPSALELRPYAETAMAAAPTTPALDARPRMDGLSRMAGLEWRPSKSNAACGQCGERRREGPVC